MTIKLRTLKFIDGIFGNILCRVVRRPRHQTRNPGNPIDTVLVIRPGGIGDAALLIPTITMLKKSFSAHISVLAEKRNAAVFSLCTCVDRILLYDRPKDLLSILRGTYDVAIDTEQWHRLSAVTARMTGAPMLIGYGTNERRRLFTHVVPYSLDEHEETAFLRLLEPLGGAMSFHDAGPFLVVPPEPAASARRALQPLHTREIVALFPGGSIGEKRWHVEKFRQTANLLAGRGYGIVIVGGKDDRRSGSVIAAGVTGALNLCGILSLQETAAVLQRVSLLITGDSGIMHLASGLGTKIIAIFGPGNEKKWAPRGTHAAVVKTALHCRPCSKFGYTPRCHHQGACMEEIPVAEVYEKTVALLEG